MKTEKMARLTLFTIASFLAGSCTKEEVKLSQLIINGNVESGTDTPTGWVTRGDSKQIAKWDNAESFSPTRSLKISSVNSDSSQLTLWTQRITNNIPSGKAVTLKVMIKGNLTGYGVCIAIRGDDKISTDGLADGNAEQFVTTQNVTPITGKFNWKEVSIKLDHVDPTIKILTIYLIYSGCTTGEAYFDDISLTF